MTGWIPAGWRSKSANTIASLSTPYWFANWATPGAWSSSHSRVLNMTLLNRSTFMPNDPKLAVRIIIHLAMFRVPAAKSDWCVACRLIITSNDFVVWLKTHHLGLIHMTIGCPSAGYTGTGFGDIPSVDTPTKSTLPCTFQILQRSCQFIQIHQRIRAMQSSTSSFSVFNRFKYLPASWLAQSAEKIMAIALPSPSNRIPHLDWMNIWSRNSGACCNAWPRLALLTEKVWNISMVKQVRLFEL